MKNHTYKIDLGKIYLMSSWPGGLFEKVEERMELNEIKSVSWHMRPFSKDSRMRIKLWANDDFTGESFTMNRGEFVTSEAFDPLRVHLEPLAESGKLVTTVDITTFLPYVDVKRPRPRNNS